MMDAHKIRQTTDALFGALKKNDEATGLVAAQALATQLLIDVNRIANALETLASPPAKQEIAVTGSEPLFTADNVRVLLDKVGEVVRDGYRFRP